VNRHAQIIFSQWFDTRFITTRLTNASVVKSIFEMIWAKRQEIGPNKDMCTWPEVLRAKKIRSMCAQIMSAEDRTLRIP
jgi:hypothetical protein